MTINNFDNILIKKNEDFKNSKVLALKYHASISNPFEIRAIIIPDFNILEKDVNELINKEILFSITYGDKIKNYSGLISQIKYKIFIDESGSSNIHTTLKILPHLSLLKMQNGYRCFHQKKAIDIIEFFMQKILKDYKELKYSINDLYHKDKQIKKINIVQYGESDFDFLTRLLKEEKLNYYFVQSKEDHQIIFTDDLVKSFNGLKTPKDLKLNVFAHQNQADLHSKTHFSAYLNDSLSHYRRVVKRKESSLRMFDYDFRNFPLPTETSVQVDCNHSWQVVSGAFKKSQDVLSSSSAEINQKNKQLNNILQTETDTLSFESHNHDLTLGGLVALDFDPLLAFKKEEKVYISEMKEKYSIFRNSLFGTRKVKAFLENAPYVFPFEKFIHIKHQVHGPCTAVVAGEALGNPAEVDENFFIKISFPWQDAKSSSASSDKITSEFIYARMGHLFAGVGRGSVVLPRIGDEVIVCFENGDPELPLIMSSVYNKINYPPIQIPDEADVSILRTSLSEKNDSKKFNEIIFDERKGKEQIAIHAKKDLLQVSEENNSLKAKNYNIEVLENTSFKTKNHEIEIGEDGKIVVKNGGFTLDIEGSNISLKAAKTIEIKASKIELSGKQGKLVID